jgi:hypothetical protein
VARHDLLAITVSNLLFSVPAALGYLLVRGKRWVRWLFLIAVVLFATVTALLSLDIGFGPDALNEPVNVVVPSMLIAVSIVFAFAVFHYFSHEPKA